MTNLVAEQRRAAQSVIAQAAHSGVTSDGLAPLLRPLVGLTAPQAMANERYYEAVLDATLEAHPRMTQENAEGKARRAAAQYAGKQHRYRAQTIARTELAAAYNHGSYAATKDAQERGYIGDCKKTWLTAADERVCKVCGGMDGEAVQIDARFSVGVLLPPGHPSCRCAVAYDEVAPPVAPIGEAEESLEAKLSETP